MRTTSDQIKELDHRHSDGIDVTCCGTRARTACSSPSRTSASIMGEYNAQIIDEFRANAGRVSGMWEEVPLLLLRHTGAKSGVSRVDPVAYLPNDWGYLIWAANGAAPNNPDWYHNLKAHPTASNEVGTETIDVVAEETTGEERERLFAKAAERYPQLAEIASKTHRVIPMITLTPRTRG